MPMIARIVAVSFLVASVAAGQTGQPSPIPDPDPNQKLETTTRVVAPGEAKGAAAQPGTVATADDLLTVLENSGKDLRTLSSDLRKTKFFDEINGGGTQVQGGKLIFVSEPQADAGGVAQPPRRKFEVDFEYTIFDDKTKNNDKQTFIFDGEWLIEKSVKDKQIHKRRVVPPGKVMDPLAIGEGPFPLPIGQKKAKILERFDAELLPPDKFESFQGGKCPDELKGTWQLRLTPKPEFERDFRLKEVRLWYRKDNYLPRMAWTADRDGSSDEYYLTAMVVNEPVPAGAFDTATPAGWVEQVDEFRKEKADK